MRAVTLIVLASLFGSAAPQESGRTVSGNVEDASTHRGIYGVKVSAVGDQGTVPTITDSDGNYVLHLASSVKAGQTVRIRFEKSEYQSQDKEHPIAISAFMWTIRADKIWSPKSLTVASNNCLNNHRASSGLLAQRRVMRPSIESASKSKTWKSVVVANEKRMSRSWKLRATKSGRSFPNNNCFKRAPLFGVGKDSPSSKNSSSYLLPTRAKIAQPQLRFTLPHLSRQSSTITDSRTGSKLPPIWHSSAAY